MSKVERFPLRYSLWCCTTTYLPNDQASQTNTVAGLVLWGIVIQSSLIAIPKLSSEFRTQERSTKPQRQETSIRSPQITSN